MNLIIQMKYSQLVEACVQTSKSLRVHKFRVKRWDLEDALVVTLKRYTAYLYGDFVTGIPMEGELVRECFGGVTRGGDIVGWGGERADLVRAFSEKWKTLEKGLPDDLIAMVAGVDAAVWREGCGYEVLKNHETLLDALYDLFKEWTKAILPNPQPAQAAKRGRDFIKRLKIAIDRKKAEYQGLPKPGRTDAASDGQGTAPESFSLVTGTLIDEMIGMEAVKRQIIELSAYYAMIREMPKVMPRPLHTVFTGNPGTGKTTAARMLGKIFWEKGILPKDVFVETDIQSITSSYLGDTPKVVKEKIAQAMGGVLFIDEAYTLVRSEYGREAINVLLKAMEDNAGKFMVIVAGYPKEMDEFIRYNPGLASRFVNRVSFPDYSDAELQQIFLSMLGKQGFSLSPEAMEKLPGHIHAIRVEHKENFGNAREMRTYAEMCLSRYAIRTARQTKRRPVLTAEDLERPGEVSRKAVDAPFDRQLNELVGLGEVKKEILDLRMFIRNQLDRKEKGLPTQQLSLHMVFTGNPGTGKTTVARLIAQMLKELGILYRGHTVEVSRRDLVADHLGGTAKITAERVREARGGVLFVDEAYMLRNGSQDSFGQEAVDTLMKLMEDERGSLVVIVAGYTEEMEAFLEMNPGMKSRFTRRIHFPDYDADELFAILQRLCERQGYRLSEEANRAAREHIGRMVAAKTRTFGNAREIRTLFEQITVRQAARLYANPHASPDAEALQLLLDADIPPFVGG